jgi:chromosomal replication initiator protein
MAMRSGRGNQGMQDIWQSVLDDIRGQVNKQAFDNWFAPMACVHVDDDRIVLEVPHSDFASWVREHYLRVIQESLRKVTHREMHVEFVSGEPVGIEEDLAAVPAPEAMRMRHSGGELPLFGGLEMAQGERTEPSPPRRSAPVIVSARDDVTPSDINPDYTFDNFVVGTSNQFAHAACEAAAENPAGSFNPLFVYGGVGLGKTHLLHAIGNRIRERHPAKRVRYISSEAYINELIQCIKHDRMDEFRYRYRTECDVLLVDDIQFFAGKDRTQDEFFHTFNSLYGAHRQIVLTSDRVPNEVPGLEERLRTRFEWGLIADVQPPEIETRAAILEKKAEREAIALPEDVAMFLATNIKSNVRILEGSLIRLYAYASITGRPLDLRLARDVLKDVLSDQSRVPTIDQVTKLVAGYYNVKVVDLRGPRRHKVIARPRMVAMYLCRKHTGESFPEIGRRFGNRDHSTVINAVTKIEKLLPTDHGLQRTVRDLERQLEA